MPQTLAQSFYLGPFAVYTSDTGMQDPVTGIPYLGGTLHEGDYVDLTKEARLRSGTCALGRTSTPGDRFVRLSPTATYSNIGLASLWISLPTTVGQVAITAAGTGSGTGSVSVLDHSRRHLRDPAG